ncbi:MAG TPA: DUF4157 domain-containing protein [Steroidobacteraceae bacterium]|nr:DUF4157 domain-containing protein [Steroidobacteraceae bacterium]
MRLAPGKHVTLPAEVRGALEQLFGNDAAPLDHVRVIEHSLFARLHGGAVATTRRRRIFLRGSAAEFFGNPTLMLHEYCHVLRQWEPRRLSTMRYLRECLRRGYWNNRFEIEAREFASEHEPRFRQMLRDMSAMHGAAPARSAAGVALRINLRGGG